MHINNSFFVEVNMRLRSLFETVGVKIVLVTTREQVREDREAEGWGKKMREG